MFANLARWSRWVLAVPLAIGAGYVAAAALSAVTPGDGALVYPAVFLSGLAYVVASLIVAYRVAPAHRRIVATVLAILIVGDMTLVHVVSPAGLVPGFSVAEVEGSGFDLLLHLLGVDPSAELRHGIVKVAGILAGCTLVLGVHARRRPRGLGRGLR